MNENEAKARAEFERMGLPAVKARLSDKSQWKSRKVRIPAERWVAEKEQEHRDALRDSATRAADAAVKMATSSWSSKNWGVLGAIAAVVAALVALASLL